MVDTQLIPRGISDPRVVAAMREIPREEFAQLTDRGIAYGDFALPIGDGQTISQPYMVAIMTEKLKLKGEEKVLEIGTGSGYQAAILAKLAEKVITIERIPTLAEKAKAIFERLGIKNIEVMVSDGTEGYEKTAPYDGIIVAAATPSVPLPLIEQLAEGGRLVIPLGDRYQQVLTTIRKVKGILETEASIACVFVPLLGKYGFSEI